MDIEEAIKRHDFMNNPIVVLLTKNKEWNEAAIIERYNTILRFNEQLEAEVIPEGEKSYFEQAIKWQYEDIEKRKNDNIIFQQMIDRIAGDMNIEKKGEEQ